MTKMLAISVWLMAAGALYMAAIEIISPIFIPMIFIWLSIAVSLFGIGWVFWREL